MRCVRAQSNIPSFISTAKSQSTSNTRLQELLAAEFRVPSWFWSAKVQDASGYFYANSGDTVVTVSHFLVKYIANSKESPPPNEPYGWHTPSFVTTWEPGKLTLLCFNFPAEAQKSFKETLLAAQPTHLTSHPFAVHSLVLDHMVDLHDTAIWKFRDAVRLQEQSRPTLQHPKPDYAGLHDLARHVMHASEVSEIALNVIDSILQKVSTFNTTPAAQSATHMNIAADIRRHRSILQCINRRSQALEERLRNEINLAFHIASEHDSLIQAQIAHAANIDSRAMKTISILGMVFLPGTFISVSQHPHRLMIETVPSNVAMTGTFQHVILLFHPRQRRRRNCRVMEYV